MKLQEADLQWPQWRGPRRDGQLAGKPWPATLDRDLTGATAYRWTEDTVRGRND